MKIGNRKILVALLNKMARVSLERDDENFVVSEPAPNGVSAAAGNMFEPDNSETILLAVCWKDGFVALLEKKNNKWKVCCTKQKEEWETQNDAVRNWIGEIFCC